MITLLSLDTSTTSTGWAIFKNGVYQESGGASQETKFSR